MTSLTVRLAGAATLALAILPVAAISTSAQAAPVVQVRDLDLNTTAGQVAFQERTAQAAKTFCKGRTNPASRTLMGATCVAAVKAEMTEKLELVQQARREQAQRYAAR